MKIIDDIEVSRLQLRLVRIGDLINIEGPILSLFQDRTSKKLYLFDWVDSEGSFNRWLIYHVKANAIYKFINKQISYKELLRTVNYDDFYYADIDSSKEEINYIIKRTTDIPEIYKTSNEVYFGEEDCIGFNKIKETVNGLINNKNPIVRMTDFSSFGANIGKGKLVKLIYQRNEYPVFSESANLNQARRIGGNPLSKYASLNIKRQNEITINRVPEYQAMEI